MKITLFLVILVIGLTLSGCFQVHRTVQVEKDGSGKLIQKILFDSSLLQNMGGGSSIYDEKKLLKEADKLGEGVQYVSSRALDEETLKGYEVIYAFSDITKLKLEKDACASLMDMGLGSKHKDYIGFRFKKGKTAELTISLPPGDEEESEVEEGEEDFSEEDEDWEMTKQIFANLQISTRIVVAGKISETDADHLEKNEIILEEMNFREMMQDEKVVRLVKKMDQSKEMGFDSIDHEVPGYKIESKEVITIKFK